MAERRYDEAEVAEIFRRAAEAQQQRTQIPYATGQGMTLEALQEIGNEVGLPAELIRHAASSLDRGGRSYTKRVAGLPLGVGHSVDLERRLSDGEWERLVVDLRETFDARGRLRQDGSFRQWSNGNLQALLEPLEDGERLRLRTTNGTARFWMTFGIAFLGVTVASLLGAVGDPSGGGWATTGVFAAIGAGAVAMGALRLPGWARTRRRQMAEIAARTTALTSGPGRG